MARQEKLTKQEKGKEDPDFWKEDFKNREQSKTEEKPIAREELTGKLLSEPKKAVEKFLDNNDYADFKELGVKFLKADSGSRLEVAKDLANFEKIYGGQGRDVRFKKMAELFAKYVGKEEDLPVKIRGGLDEIKNKPLIEAKRAELDDIYAKGPEGKAIRRIEKAA